MLLDDRVAVEAYPLFDDLVDASTAPRLMDVRRVAKSLLGEVHRRYTRGASACEAKAPVQVLACSDDELELALADPGPPVGFAPCVWSGGTSPHREVWRRE